MDDSNNTDTLWHQQCIIVPTLLVTCQARTTPATIRQAMWCNGNS